MSHKSLQYRLIEGDVASRTNALVLTQPVDNTEDAAIDVCIMVYHTPYCTHIEKCKVGSAGVVSSSWNKWVMQGTVPVYVPLLLTCWGRKMTGHNNMPPPVCEHIPYLEAKTDMQADS